MISIAELKNRFLRDENSRRLGAIASDLARLSSLAQREPANLAAFENGFVEVKLFTEWAAEDLDLKTQELILALQRTLSHFDSQNFSSHRDEIKQETSKWSETILSISGLC